MRSAPFTVTPGDGSFGLLKNASPGMILGTIPASDEGAFNVVKHGGLKGLMGLLRAIPQSLEARAEVERIRRSPRRDIEAKWRSASG